MWNLSTRAWVHVDFRSKAIIYVLIIALIIAVDQLIKSLIICSMLPGNTIPLIGHYVFLTYVRNKGAAFGMFSDRAAVLAVVSTVFIVAIILHLIFSRQQRLMTNIALAFLLGGSMGNLIDRFLRGFVVDYVHVISTPVFNFADVMINAGVGLLILDLFINSKWSREIKSRK